MASDIQSLREQRETLLSQAEGLSAKVDATPEESAQFDAVLNQIGDLDTQIKQAETLTQAAADRTARMQAARAVQHAGRKTAPEPGNASDIRVGKARVEDDPTRGFKNLADFALEIYNCGPSLHNLTGNARLRMAAGTGMSQGVTADGGILVPPAFSKAIWDAARVRSESMLSYCDTQTIDSGVESVSIPASAETSRVDGSRWGGIRGYWKSELTEMTASKPKLRELKVSPHELYVFGYISDKLLRSAPGLASSLMSNAAADEINFKLGDSVFNGDGVGKPRGIISHPATIAVAKETGQGTVKLVAENINKMYSRCHANWRSGAAWFINQEVEPVLEALQMTVGTGGVPLYLPPGGISAAPLGRLKGLPVIPVEYCSALGDLGDIVLANLKSYLMGVRGMVDSSESMHLKFDYAQTAFRWIFEADGQPYLASAITPYKGTATTSPIITLAAR